MSGGDRRQPFDMQRNDSVRSMEPRGMNPQSGMFSPNPPRPMGERGRETPPGPPRTPKDDDDDVVYSSVNDPRMNRVHTPTMRPPSGPRPGLPPDLNSSPRPLSRTESRQSFEVRGPSGLDNRGEPKLIPRESPLARPLSSDMVKTPFQYRPDSQSTPPLSPKPDFQSPRPQSISPQDSLDRQRIESRSITPNNSPMTPKPTPDLRQASRSDDSKSDSGKLTPSNGEDNRTSPAPPADQTNKTGPSGVGPEKPPSVLSGSVSPIPKSNDPSRITTPLPVGKDNQQSDQLNSKSPDISQNSTPISVKGNESTAGTPLPEKDSGSHSREDTPSKTPDISENFDHSNKTERPKSLKRSPSLKQDLGNNSDNEGRKTPLVRTPSRTSSAGKGNDPRSPLQRKPSGKRPKTPKTPDGDHDSGVDESTQRKDGPTTNGLSSPSKSPSKIPAPKKLSTLPSPTKSSKNSPKTPEAPPTAEKKSTTTLGIMEGFSPDNLALPPKSRIPLKNSTQTQTAIVPMNKIQVGAAPSPNLKTVKSKIGSLQNATHKPGGGNVKIEHRKLDWKAEPRIAAKNDAYQPGGGDKKIPQVKLKWEAKPKVGSLDNATHKPGGGEKKIESVKLDFKDKAKPKVGSKDNLKHTPGGGNVKIEDQKLEVKAQSKIGSLDNVKHKPGGGDRKIFDDKEYLRQMSGCTSRAASEGIPSGTQDGWRSASASRRTSRDQQTCGDRRYRSESRLGLRTPEPRMGMSPREHEHCSLWDKHDQETKALVQEEESPEIKTPDLVTPVKETRAQENTIAELTSEGKDLNSNQPIENINAIEANFTITPKPDNISTCVDKAAKQEGKENIVITEQKRQNNGDTKDTQNKQHDNKGLTAATVSKPLEMDKNKEQDSKSLKTAKEDNFSEIATTDVNNAKEIANKKNDPQGSATNVNKPQEVEEKSKVKNNTSLAEGIKLQDSSSHVDKNKLPDSTSHVDKSKLQDSTSHVDKSKLQDSTSHVDKSKLQDSTSHVDKSKLQDSTSHVDKSKLQDNTSHVDKSKLQDSTSSKTEKGDKLSETAKTGSVKNTTEITEQNQNVYKKLESKEDTVKEIKEIDCKEAVGNINVSNSPDSGVSISSGNVNNQNRVDGNMMQSDVNTLFPKPGTKQM
ncbi:microtubule-associated protein tau-like isoform X2 [Macrosteles quadrilineatus]|uniref:microtubule-associated protein tau-like isoform X2 n=1 Tax=Macrosteles quadrilineatus TaxID=74068 RepID=UPI0023E1D70C|nr:microtubule-associated protein tau-like isoform X2 [Macrosteles quadrilineatus]